MTSKYKIHSPVFIKARPVWPVGRSTVLNDYVGFRALVQRTGDGPARVRLTASCIYRLTVDGVFVGHGPARAPHGRYRVDEYDLGAFLKPAGTGVSVVSIEVVGYNANSYYLLDQPSFLCAEIDADGRVWHTGTGGGIDAIELRYKRQRVPRFSYQRPSMEAYVLSPGWDAWRHDPAAGVVTLPVEDGGDKPTLERRMPYPAYGTRMASRHVATGTVEPCTPVKLRRDRSLTAIGPNLKGFPEDQLEITPTVDFQKYKTLVVPVGKTIGRDDRMQVTPTTAQIVDLGTNLSGFVGLTLECQQPGRFVVLWEELLVDGDVSCMRIDCANMAAFDLTAPGTYRVETIEPYTMRYLKVMASEGRAHVSNIFVREYANPEMERTTFSCSDPKLNRVYNAAVQTLRQNAADLLTDCPGRERAGWLCDSFFSGRVAMDLSGNSVAEAKFLEDYLLGPQLPHLPEGMLPMCYPADHFRGGFIPQWPMWLVLQLEEYLARSGDQAMIDGYTPRIEALLKYFEKFVNADGLLEKLEGWRFVEWSKANELTLDVNYPTNMLYAATLEAASRLYRRPEWATQAARVREAVERHSFDGEWFVDNALRDAAGVLKTTGERTEVCQYYAFFFGVATAEKHPVLWKRLTEDFGPQRAATGAYKEIYPANAFIGNYLRMEVLSRAGLQPQIEREISGYFLKMADLTGTLWENDGTYASCNHGFAAHVARWLFRDLVGVHEIDPVHRRVIIRFSPNTLSWADLKQAVGAGFVELSWTRAADGAVEYRLAVPAGYTVDVQACGVTARRV